MRQTRSCYCQRVNRLLMLVALLAATSAGAAAQRTVVEDAGGGRKQEKHYNAENNVDQGAAMSDTPHPTSDLIHRIWMSSVLFGLLAVILGAVMLAWPGPSILVASALLMRCCKRF